MKVFRFSGFSASCILLVKIDVDRNEEAVLAGAKTWLRASSWFLIEVYRHEYLEKIEMAFRGSGLRLMRVEQRPIPGLGREYRDRDNWWLSAQRIT
jgi:hypothetical protein